MILPRSSAASTTNRTGFASCGVIWTSTDSSPSALLIRAAQFEPPFSTFGKAPPIATRTASPLGACRYSTSFSSTSAGASVMSRSSTRRRAAIIGNVRAAVNAVAAPGSAAR
jgi:hypothetical protein